MVVIARAVAMMAALHLAASLVLLRVLASLLLRQQPMLLKVLGPTEVH